MQYNFDEIIDRRGTNALNTDGFRQYIFHDDTITFPYADDDLVRMWVADMEFAAPDCVIDAMRNRLDRRIYGYTKLFDPAYYDAFAGWTQRHYGWQCAREHLVTSPGIIPALYELVGYLCGADDKVLILTPSYAYFKHAVDHHGLELVCSDLVNDAGRYTIDYDDLARKLADERVRLCIFCNPHNPTGRVWTPDELARFGKLCADNNVWVISDEIHCDLLRGGLTHTPLAKVLPGYDRVITCMAPSKTFNLAGMMISNIVIPNDELRTTWQKKHYDFLNPLSIAASQGAYEHGDEWLTQLKAYLDGNFAFMESYLHEHLPRAVFTISQATYLAWVDIRAYIDDPAVFLPLWFAANAGVLLEGGDMFVRHSDGFIRLNLACPRSTLTTGLERICTALNARYS